MLLLFIVVGLCATGAREISSHLEEEGLREGKMPRVHYWDRLKAAALGSDPSTPSLIQSSEQQKQKERISERELKEMCERGDAVVRAGAFEETPEGEEEMHESFSLLLLCALLILTFLIAYLLRESPIEIVHESGGAILLGVVVGGLVRAVSGEAWLKEFTTFDTNVFFLFLLPPIIFEAGYSMNRRVFFKNSFSVCIYAFAGTLISTFVFGLILYIMNFAIPQHSLEFLECLTFGALISATDPVTVLAIFKELHVDVDLYANVFGESVLNDAIAIVLYKTFTTFLHGSDAVTFVRVVLASSYFVLIFAGSIALGVLISLLVALLFKYLDFQKHVVLEGSLLLLFAYSIYLAAEGFELSGIVSILFSGMTMSHYVRPNLTEETRHFSIHFFEVTGFIVETLIFSFLGFSMFSFAQEYNGPMIATCVIACLIGRFLNIFPLSYIINRLRPNHPVPFSHQLMMWFAGLRGAIAFSLALEAKDSSENGTVILSTTLVIVFVTVIGLGGLTTKVLRALGIQTGVTSSTVRSESLDTLLVFDRNYFIPFFTRSQPPPVHTSEGQIELNQMPPLDRSEIVMSDEDGMSEIDLGEADGKGKERVEEREEEEEDIEISHEI